MKLPWHNIKDFFKGQWVELIDCDWEPNKPFPRQAGVRHHAYDRNELLSMIKCSAPIEGSTILYLGVVNAVLEHPRYDGRVAML